MIVDETKMDGISDSDNFLNSLGDGERKRDLAIAEVYLSFMLA